MPKLYDAVAREILDRFPGAVLTYTGQRPPGPIEIIEAKISTVTAEPDKVIRIAGPRPYLIHIEAQAGRDFRLAHRLRWYNTLLDYKHKLRVQSIAILLHPRTDTHDLTGVLDLSIPDGDRVDTFYYKVIRAWEQSAESILRGDPGAWPLAPLGNVPTIDVPEVIQDIKARLARKTRFEFSGIIMESTLILAGLRLGQDELQTLRGSLPMRIRGLEKSSYFEVIREEGRIQEARKLLLQLGRIRFGPRSREISRKIKSIDNLKHLHRLSERLLHVSSWAELLDEPS